MKKLFSLLLLLISFSAFGQSDTGKTIVEGGVMYESYRSGSYEIKLGSAVNGTTAQRPSSPGESMMRYNTDLKKWEFWNGLYWISYPAGNVINREYLTWLEPHDQAQVYNSDKGIKRISGSGDIETFSNETISRGEAFVFKITSVADNASRFGLMDAQSGVIDDNIVAGYLNANVLGLEGASTVYNEGIAAVNGNYWRVAIADDGEISLDKSTDGGLTWTEKHPFTPDAGAGDQYYLVFYGAAPNFGTDEVFKMNIDGITQGAFSLTTNGTSGVATYNPTASVLNIPNYTPYLVYTALLTQSSTDPIAATVLQNTMGTVTASAFSTDEYILLETTIDYDPAKVFIGGFATAEGNGAVYVPIISGGVLAGYYSVNAYAEAGKLAFQVAFYTDAFAAASMSSLLTTNRFSMPEVRVYP